MYQPKTCNIQARRINFPIPVHDLLPPEIAWREKMPFATGAGLAVGDAEDTRDSLFAKIARDAGTDEQTMVQRLYEQFQYHKLVLPKAVNKDNLLEVCRAAHAA